MINVSSSSRKLFLVLFILSCLEISSPPPAGGQGGSLRWNGFFDATLFAASGGPPDAADAGLSGGELDLVLVSRFRTEGKEEQEWRYRLSFLADVSLSAERRAARDSAPSEVEVALERAILRYELSDPLTFSAGQFHTPVSHWREVYHRGRWLHVAASRPRMVEFDGRFLPSHFLGAMVEGETWAGGLNLSYRVGLGDGRPELTTADRAPRLESDGAVVLGLGIEPARARGFNMGAAFYTDGLTLEAASGPAVVREIDETVVSAHLSWSRGINRIIGELARIEHRDAASGQRFDNDAFYLEITYGLPFFRRRMTLYNRVEELRIEPGDPVLVQAMSSRVNLLGVRYDVDRKSALKAEIRQTSARNFRDAFELLIQTSLAF